VILPINPAREIFGDPRSCARILPIAGRGGIGLALLRVGFPIVYGPILGGVLCVRGATNCFTLEHPTDKQFNP